MSRNICSIARTIEPSSVGDFGDGYWCDHVDFWLGRPDSNIASDFVGLSQPVLPLVVRTNSSCSFLSYLTRRLTAAQPLACGWMERRISLNIPLSWTPFELESYWLEFGPGFQSSKTLITRIVCRRNTIYRI